MTEKGKELIKDHYGFEDLIAIMTYLRSDEGCPWDRTQTHSSIRKNLIEECYEAAEGIDANDPHLMCEEFGDILLQVVFHAQIARENGEFSIDDVINAVSRKLICRHPHIFSDQYASDPATALDRWEEIKKREKKDDTLYKTMDRVARTLPSLMRTQKLLKKAEKGGFPAGGQAVSPDVLKDRYMRLCADANASGVDLEELGYRANEEFLEKFNDH